MNENQNVDNIAYKYADAIVPRPFVVCGVELRPFCLGHLLLLKDVLNSLYLAPEQLDTNTTDGLTQLFTAVIICGMSFEDGLLFLTDETEQDDTINRFTDNLHQLMKSQEDWNYWREIKVFESYLNFYVDLPLFKEINKGDKELPSGMDDITSTVVLFNKLNLSESEVLNMSLKKLNYMKLSFLEQEGAVRVRDKKTVKSIKRFIEQKEKQKKQERINKVIDALKG